MGPLGPGHCGTITPAGGLIMVMNGNIISRARTRLMRQRGVTRSRSRSALDQIKRGTTGLRASTSGITGMPAIAEARNRLRARLNLDPLPVPDEQPPVGAAALPNQAFPTPAVAAVADFRQIPGFTIPGLDLPTTVLAERGVERRPELMDPTETSTGALIS